MTILMTMVMSMTVMRLKNDGWMALIEHLIQGLDTDFDGAPSQGWLKKVF